jgi:hypothetical protein
MQCIYSDVSEASFRKTSVSLNSTEDFWEFSLGKFENAVPGGFQQLEQVHYWRAFQPPRKEIL